MASCRMSECPDVEPRRKAAPRRGVRITLQFRAGCRVSRIRLFCCSMRLAAAQSIRARGAARRTDEQTNRRQGRWVKSGSWDIRRLARLIQADRWVKGLDIRPRAREASRLLSAPDLRPPALGPAHREPERGIGPVAPRFERRPNPDRRRRPRSARSARIIDRAPTRILWRFCVISGNVGEPEQLPKKSQLFRTGIAPAAYSRLTRRRPTNGSLPRRS